MGYGGSGWWRLDGTRVIKRRGIGLVLMFGVFRVGNWLSANQRQAWRLRPSSSSCLIQIFPLVSLTGPTPPNIDATVLP